MREVPIRGASIRVGQLLKLVDVAESGSDAKRLLEDGAVRVNGEVELRRGRQLRAGDAVEVNGEQLLIRGE